mmetsp:Transcript_5700/g.16280  ORF Transcript_5700/g.16280 Transcript_5700/m.16280 type:complete len:1043 (+) Transcript_5700:218-3346(+)|eukprot:CAMPEP_0206147892 /NCGR_PEP_ID=MMETSP1473-20131121/34914_1 /ASSEMBLY_ACC=CAM_ASM_001109 /TAXON_ID=1461547 /ORGANISM="Stichococcus sp, Strain RCC1054" /LENGTH=1042 /DNA_ID=CAMNT_0053545027 /DNA_START=176 /DNA_END=3304 /DNA_ORIENTATION=-
MLKFLGSSSTRRKSTSSEDDYGSDDSWNEDGLKDRRAATQRRTACKPARAETGARGRGGRTSRFAGVGASNNRSGTWQARILVQGKVTHLGYYKEEEDAARAYDRVSLAQSAGAATNFPASSYSEEDIQHLASLDRAGLQLALGVKPMQKSSRFRGVSRKKLKWEAKVMVQRKWAYRELFSTEEAAARAYDAAVWALKPPEVAQAFVNFKDSAPFFKDGAPFSPQVPNQPIQHIQASPIESVEDQDDVDEHVLSLPGPRTADGAPATGRRSGSVRLRQSGGMPTHGDGATEVVQLARAGSSDASLSHASGTVSDASLVSSATRLNSTHQQLLNPFPAGAPQLPSIPSNTGSRPATPPLHHSRDLTHQAEAAANAHGNAIPFGGPNGSANAQQSTSSNPLLVGGSGSGGSFTGSGVGSYVSRSGSSWTNGSFTGPSQVLPRSSASFTAGITNNSCTFTIGTNPGLGRDNDSGSGPLAGLRSLFRSHTIDTQLQAQLPGASGALLQHMTSLPAFVDSSLPHPPQARPPISINTTRRDSGSPHTSAAAGVPLHQGPESFTMFHSPGSPSWAEASERLLRDTTGMLAQANAWIQPQGDSGTADNCVDRLAQGGHLQAPTPGAAAGTPSPMSTRGPAPPGAPASVFGAASTAGWKPGFTSSYGSYAQSGSPQQPPGTPSPQVPGCGGSNDHAMACLPPTQMGSTRSPSSARGNGPPLHPGPLPHLQAGSASPMAQGAPMASVTPSPHTRSSGARNAATEPPPGRHLRTDCHSLSSSQRLPSLDLEGIDADTWHPGAPGLAGGAGHAPLVTRSASTSALGAHGSFTSRKRSASPRALQCVSMHRSASFATSADPRGTSNHGHGSPLAPLDFLNHHFNPDVSSIPELMEQPAPSLKEPPHASYQIGGEALPPGFGRATYGLHGMHPTPSDAHTAVKSEAELGDYGDARGEFNPFPGGNFGGEGVPPGGAPMYHSVPPDMGPVAPPGNGQFGGQHGGQHGGHQDGEPMTLASGGAEPFPFGGAHGGDHVMEDGEAAAWLRQAYHQPPPYN